MARVRCGHESFTRGPLDLAQFLQGHDALNAMPMPDQQVPEMNNPECSVVIPTRDCASYIAAALHSVRTQDCTNLEVIVVNDGSTDGTDDVLRRFSDNWPELRIVATTGIGPAGARNAALAVARAPLVAFLDADDIWWPEKLGRQLAFHRANPDVSFSFTDYLHIDPQGQPLGTCFEYWRPRFLKDQGSDQSYSCFPEPEATILATNVVGTSTVVASLRDLQIANGFGNSCSAEDWRTWLRLAGSGRVAVSKAVAATYLVRPNSVSRRLMDRINAIEAVIAEYEFRNDASFRAALRSTRAVAMTARAEYWRAERALLSAFMCRLHAIMMHPDRNNVLGALGDIRAFVRSGAPV
jgi:glycosyltransferase involved in cell wall biosynthesis